MKKINTFTNVDVDEIIDIVISNKNQFYYGGLRIKNKICDILKQLKDKDTLWRSYENYEIYTSIKYHFIFFR